MSSYRLAAVVSFSLLASLYFVNGYCHAQDAVAKRFITNNGQRPGGLFAPGIMVGKTLYISGKGDYRPDGDLGQKVQNCLAEIETVLKQAGLDRRNVVKSFCYLENREWYDEFNQHYGSFFKEHAPARTTLAVPHVPGDSRVEITCIAFADPAELKAFGPPAPGGRPYSSAIQAGDTLYLSGRGDQLADGTHPATFEEQVRQTMRNVQTGLAMAGIGYSNIVMSHIFVDDAANLQAANRIHDEFFGKGDGPARSSIVVDWIPGGSHVEITCIATTDLSRRKTIRPDGMKLEAGSTSSPAVWSGSTLYLSGYPGLYETSGVKANDVRTQVQQMAQGHLKILEASGLGLSDIVAGWVCLADIEDYAAMNEEYRKYYALGPGTRTTLMPSSKQAPSSVRVEGTFIAAKTQTVSP